MHKRYYSARDQIVRPSDMGKTHDGMVKEFGGNVERIAGKSVRDQVMQGSERISIARRPEVAEWVREAVARLDNLVGSKDRMEIMEACGRNCSEHNQGLINRALARRRKFASIDEFLAAEVKKPVKGTRLARNGNELHQFYTPSKYTPPMRCFCGLLRDLPPEKTVSQTYCHCSKAFVKRFWESILERPVEVELVRSAVSGAQECEFVIRL